MLPFQAGKKSGFQFQNCYSIRCQSIWTLCLVRQQSQNHSWLLSTPWQFRGGTFQPFVIFRSVVKLTFLLLVVREPLGICVSCCPLRTPFLNVERRKTLTYFTTKQQTQTHQRPSGRKRVNSETRTWSWNLCFALEYSPDWCEVLSGIPIS